jgi:hypothetical protein
MTAMPALMVRQSVHDSSHDSGAPDHRAQSADGHDQPVQQWHARQRKPHRQRLDRGAQADRYAHADHRRPAASPTIPGAQATRASRHGQHQHDGLGAARAEAVEQDASRQLGAGKPEEIEAREQAEIARGKSQFTRQVRREAEIDAPEHIRDQEAEREERQHAPARRRMVGLGGHVSGGLVVDAVMHALSSPAWCKTSERYLRQL